MYYFRVAIICLSTLLAACGHSKDKPTPMETASIRESRDVSNNLRPASTCPDDTSLQLQKVTEFAIGGTGFAGTMSVGEEALRAILAQPDAVKCLESIFPDATPAGQLYILLGLRLRDRAAYEQAIDHCSGRTDSVMTVSGCIGWQKPFCDPEQEIERGEFDNDLKRSAWSQSRLVVARPRNNR